ncbi:MAG: nucleotidyltransferase family protein [Anaerolinea sp.]|nr:nucleotidyltransferase family protein [Anaerolinea sp.]
MSRREVTANEKSAKYGPWPDVATARLFLGGLAREDVPQTAVASWAQTLNISTLTPWLIRGELAGAALGRYGQQWPELRHALQTDQFMAAAEWELHTKTLEQLASALQTARVTAVLLKGAALALTVYPQHVWRTMSDVDLWVQGEEMAAAVAAITALGFAIHSKEDRPIFLQRLLQGEIQLYRTDWAQGLVELHWSPFSGWWLRRVAQAATDTVWARKEALPVTAAPGAFYQLTAEDMVLHVAVHMSVNHQLGMKACQELLDIALTAERRGVDWNVVAARAQEWRVGTAVYTVLQLLNELIGATGVEVALVKLRPSRLRRWLLARFVLPESVLAGQDLRGGQARYLLLLLLVDRPRDMLYLVFRTLWPEEEWLAARYGAQSVSRWRHIWRVLRHGQV